MKINEKNVEMLLQEIKKELLMGYSSEYLSTKNIYFKSVLGKVEALLTIVDFE